MIELTKCKNSVNSDNWELIKMYPQPKLKELVDQEYLTTTKINNDLASIDSGLISSTSYTMSNSGVSTKLTVNTNVSTLFLKLLFMRFTDDYVAGDSFILDYVVTEDYKADKARWAEYDNTWYTRFINLLIEIVPQFWGALLTQMEQNFWSQKDLNQKRLSGIDIHNTSQGPNVELNNPIENGTLVNYITNQFSSIKEMSPLEAASVVSNLIKPELLYEKFYKPFKVLFTKCVYTEWILAPTIDASEE